MNIQLKKFGIIPCCGSECAGGIISRIAAGRIIYELRASKAETISLPRLLLGTPAEKQFTLQYPTVTLDGCHKACAQKAVEKYGGKVTVAINMEDIIGQAVNGESLPMNEFTKQYAAEIRKVTGTLAYVIDTLSNMGNKNSSSCSSGCACGCGGSSSASSGCGCGCDGHSHNHNHNHNAVHQSPESIAADGNDIIIYTKTGCPFCAKTVLEYQEKGITFREVNISLDPSAKQLCTDTYGIDQVPIVVKDGVIVQVGDSEGKS